MQTSSPPRLQADILYCLSPLALHPLQVLAEKFYLRPYGHIVSLCRLGLDGKQIRTYDVSFPRSDLMEKKMKYVSIAQKLVVALSLVTLLSLTAACNTMEGLGRDVEKGGENLQDAANN